MKLQTILVALCLVTSITQAQTTITGAGSTFAYPIFSKWSEAYKEKTQVELNYQSIGSSGGVKQIKSNTVDFGATDAPLKIDELSSSNLIQFPVVLGGVVPIVNIDGIKPGELQLTGEVLAKIFSGKITSWNDKQIQDLNTKIKLPNELITVVHRADGSGTTFIFTDYLSEVSSEWKQTVGKAAAVKWPASTSIGGKGNEGVAANVSRVKNSIGYVEYAYAKKNKMSYIKLQNHDGKYVEPDDTTFASAAKGADWTSVPGMGISLVNQKGTQSWPITGSTFVLLQIDKKTNIEVIKFLDWSFKNGKQMALDLDYVPIPDTLANQIREKVWMNVKK